MPEFFGMSIATALIFALGVIYFLKHDIASFTLPTHKVLDTTLERQSALPQGHISMLDDTLANPRKHETRDLWNVAQKSILHSLTKLKTPRIRARLSREDPSALRFIAILVFISGFMMSGAQWQNRIWNGLFPLSPSYVMSQGNTTNLWITPPDYTQIGQIHVTGNGGEIPDIAEGSQIRIRLYSVLGEMLPPQLSLGDKTETMTHLGEGIYGIEAVIEYATDIRITQAFIPRAHWTYALIKDTPPMISRDLPKKEDDNTEEQAAAYEILDDGQIRFPLIVKDDYGVKELKMTMNINEMVEERPLGDTAETIRLIMSQPDIDFKITPIYDMTWHSWAGLPVTFEYTAIDHKGQTATLEKIELTLPERIFEHPMAKSLIAMRKRLAWNYKDSFLDIAKNLETLLSAPDYFQNNAVIYLAIRSASARLLYVDKQNETARVAAARAVINLLWHAAIVIEDGNLSLALRELRDAQQALENAMRDPNSSEDEISQLMDNLRQKMENYFAEMQRDMQKRMADGEDFPMFSANDFGKVISPDALSKLMQDIESALRAGDEQKAQELMSQLQRMMEMMDPSMMPKLPADMQMMSDGVNELQELIERQETLLEQTIKQDRVKRLLDGSDNTAPRSMPNIEDMMKDFGMGDSPPKPKASDTPLAVDTLPNKAEQEALRYILGQLMLETAEHIDEIPESMGLAEQDMRGSEDALEENDPTTSIPHQDSAIKHLKESQEQLSQQFRARMKQMVGVGFSGAQRYDPLGRPYGGEDSSGGKPHGSQVKIPDAAEKKRIDEILKTLRDRSGDRSRSGETLDYFRRLLRQF